MRVNDCVGAGSGWVVCVGGRGGMNGMKREQRCIYLHSEAILLCLSSNNAGPHWVCFQTLISTFFLTMLLVMTHTKHIPADIYVIHSVCMGHNVTDHDTVAEIPGGPSNDLHSAYTCTCNPPCSISCRDTRNTNMVLYTL